MCIVSNIGDGWGQIFPKRYPDVPANPIFPIPEISRQEFEALRNEVNQLKLLLKAAKKFDEATGQPDCEMEEKIELISKIARAVGVNIEEVFERKK